MIIFFRLQAFRVFAVDIENKPDTNTLNKLNWLFGGAEVDHNKIISGVFVGPRKEMITPWSTNAVEITQNMGIQNIIRIEQFIATETSNPDYDPMLQKVYKNLNQEIFTLEKQPDPVLYIDDITAYNKQEGLALSPEEIKYLEELSDKLNRQLTDSEIFGFSQVNSEHCRHKIFNGRFIINGEEQPQSLFDMIKATTKANQNQVVSAYKDNCAFLQGPDIYQFAPMRQDIPDYFAISKKNAVLSIKAETHNFPTTVEPFNGAATGTGGEIRDRIGGGKGAFPVAGTAVYMTAYTRSKDGRSWEKGTSPRPWLYQNPETILVKASNGASDFGNKFGQPLICGSVLTFEHLENEKFYGYDKVIMLAGGIGFGFKKDVLKDIPGKKDKMVLLGGDNYRIGMGGGAVSSVSTGEFDNVIELNAVQRSNPEMQKRVYNAIRAMSESNTNPIVSIHDHGAGGHLNCLSELVEDTGGTIDLTKLPIGDPTLSAKEIVGNESQERMGLVLEEKDIDTLQHIADRERAPMYIIGEATGDKRFTFINSKTGEKNIDMNLDDMFGNPPKTIMQDDLIDNSFETVDYDLERIKEYIKEVLQIEAVACKDYLTNKVDRSVTGKIAKQQTAGEIQLPLNNLGVIALDHQGTAGLATSIGNAPVAGLIDPAAGSRLSITEALTNIIWAPLKNGIKSISLSANWMWPCKNKGEDARLYEAVKAAGNFATSLGINIPTGKDSLSMTQKYKDGKTVLAPGTVIISAAAEVDNINQIIEPVMVNDDESELIYISLASGTFNLGGSSFAQVCNKLGDDVPNVAEPAYIIQAFDAIQQLIKNKKILSGHDISAGGLITALLEMNFPNTRGGMNIDLGAISSTADYINVLFSENPGIIIQCKKQDNIAQQLKKSGINANIVGYPVKERKLNITTPQTSIEIDIDEMRDIWYETSYLLDKKQSGTGLALERFKNYKKQPLSFGFNKSFRGTFDQYQIDNFRNTQNGIKAAIIREKGVNGDREMAFSMYLAGLDVKDIHMTDLISGRETLEDINMIVFVGGFSNSDVLGSAKGWAGAFLYNAKAKKALDNFYKRNNTLSLGVCNGCQLMIELGLITPNHKKRPKMLFNDTGKFESAFLNVDIPQNHSVMLHTLAGSRMGIWIAHGEGKFSLPLDEHTYHIPMKYSYDQFPGNPNGSDYATAALCSDDGRHLAMMPHIERSIFPWQWAYYPESGKTNTITPWIEAFVNAREWIKTSPQTIKARQ